MEPLNSRTIISKIQAISDWLMLGVHLGLELHKLKEIEKQHFMISGPDRCKLEMIDIWLKQELNPTWSKIADALDATNEHVLASSLRQLEVTSPQNSLRTISSASASSSSTTSDVEVHVDAEIKPILEAFRKLVRRFAKIVTEIMGTLEAKRISVTTVHRFVRELEYRPDEEDMLVLSENSTMNDLFNTLRTNAYYSFYQTSLLEDIVQEYLKGEDCVEDLLLYGKDLEEFKEGTKMKEIVDQVTQAIEEEGSESAPVVRLKVKGSFGESTIRHFEQLVKDIFSNELVLFLHDFKVKRGCICATWSTPAHKMPSLVAAAKTKMNFMSSVGILKLEISDEIVFESQVDNDVPPLHLAVNQCNMATIDYLLGMGINVNEKDKNGSTPLSIACRKHYRNSEYKEVVRKLLEGGANPITHDEAGLTPLMKAVQADANPTKMDVINQLVASGVDVGDKSGYTSLMYAVVACDVTLALHLITSGANVNRVNTSGQSALLLACMKSRLDMVKMLADNGAHINTQTNTGITPLMVAIRNNNVDIAQFLLSAGADPNIQTPNGWSSLHEACKVKSSVILSALLDKGGKPDMRKTGTMPLMVACDNDFEVGVKVLLEAGAQVNTCTDTDGSTALSIAIYRGNTSIVQTLVNAGADVNAIDQYGRNAFDLAHSFHHYDIIQLIGDTLPSHRWKPRAPFPADRVEITGYERSTMEEPTITSIRAQQRNLGDHPLAPHTDSAPQN